MRNIHFLSDFEAFFGYFSLKTSILVTLDDVCWKNFGKIGQKVPQKRRKMVKKRVLFSPKNGLFCD